MTRLEGWKTYALVLAGVMVGGVLGIGLDRTVLAQPSAIKRTPLQTVDLPGTTGYEAVMGIAEIPPGGTSGRHFHHGAEIGYVMEGGLVIEHEGRPVQTVKPGEPFRIDPKAPHEAKPASGAAKILTIHMVEKGKPLAEPVK